MPLLLTLLLAGMSVPACDIDDILNTDDESASRPVLKTDSAYTGPRKRAARQDKVRCFASFGKFKRAMAKQGLRSKREVSAWHHIVGQHDHNKSVFGEYDLHCTDNVVLLKEKEHYRVNSHYTTKREKLGGKSLRDWLKPKDFDMQYAYGVTVLQELEITWTLVE